MKLKRLILPLVLVALSACDIGDININPSTADNSTDNSVTNSNNTTAAPVAEENPCASYVNSGGQTIEGDFDGVNCTYSPAFADAGNNLTTDITIPELAEGGIHIFQGSLFVGEAHANNEELTAAGIAEGGDGPTLTIEAGATLAWPDNTKFVIINRGSQIFAVGTAEKPITFTATADAVEGSAGAEDGLVEALELGKARPSPIDAWFGGVYYIAPAFAAFRGTPACEDYYGALVNEILASSESVL